MLLRVLLMTSLLVAMVGLVPTVAHAQSTTTISVAQQPPGLYDCGTTQYRVLFWPQGHAARSAHPRPDRFGVRKGVVYRSF